MTFDVKSWIEAEDERHAKMTVQKDDVFGVFCLETYTRKSEGMMVARGGGEPTICPIFGDEIPYKSVTVVCDPEQVEEVAYWLSYVHGGPYSGSAKQPDGKIAIRSDYQAW